MFSVKYHLLRNRGRSLLLVCVAVVLLACMGAYLGSMQMNRKTLNELGRTVPIRAAVINRNASREDWLSIDQWHYEKLLSVGVHDVKATAKGSAALEESARPADSETFWGGDTDITAGNTLSAFPGMKEEAITFAEGRDASFLEGADAACVVSARYAEDHGLKPGDTVVMPIYAARSQMRGGVVYLPLGEVSLQVAGVCAASEGSVSPPDLALPIEYFKQLCEGAGEVFTYQSLSALLNDGARLNEIKEELRTGQGAFLSIFENPDDKATGDCLSIEDKYFITTASKLEQSLTVYRKMLIPFFLLVIGLGVLAVFLSLRNSRRDMAVAVSLGQTTAQVSLSYLVSMLLIDLAGCAVGLPVMLAAGLPLGIALVICGAFLLCGALAAALGLLLLRRFDAMELLTKTE